MNSDFRFRISDLRNSHHPNFSSRQHQTGFTLVEMLVVIMIIALLIGLALLVGPEVTNSGNKQITQALLQNCNAILAEYTQMTGQTINNDNNGPFIWNTVTNADRNESNTGDDATEEDVNLVISSNITDETYPNNTKMNDKDGNLVNVGNQLKDEYDTSFFRLSIQQFVYVTYKIEAIRNKLYSSAAFQNGNQSLVMDLPMYTGTLKYPSGNGMLNIVDAWGTPLVYVANNVAGDTFTFDDKLPEHNGPYFASAGADRKWGDASQLLRQKQGQSLTAAQKTDADEAADNLYSYDAN